MFRLVKKPTPEVLVFLCYIPRLRITSFHNIQEVLDGQLRCMGGSSRDGLVRVQAAAQQQLGHVLPGPLLLFDCELQERLISRAKPSCDCCHQVWQDINAGAQEV